MILHSIDISCLLKLPVAMILLLLLLLLSGPTLTSAASYKFALCPKFVNNSYFDVSRDGCVDRARALTLSTDDTIECAYVGHAVPGEYGDLQAQAILQALEEDPSIAGLAISVTQSEELQVVYDEARAKNIPVVTFDSDDPESGRAAYIGTLARIISSWDLKSAKSCKNWLPRTGGSYAILTSEAPNLATRAAGIQSVLEKDQWNASAVVSYEGKNSAGIHLMRQTLEEYPELNAFLAVNSVGMGYPGWPELVQDYPETIFIAGDDAQFQLEYLKVNKVHGLVGQIPYEMGVLSVDALLSLAKHPEKEIPDFIGTNVLEHLVVPLVLPELVVDENRLPLFAVVLGMVLMVTEVVTAGLFSAWTLWNRKLRVVLLAQPEFLIMVAIGCIVFCASLIPLSMEQWNTVGTSGICMATPWLLCVGFTIIFSFLFAKTWRMNHVVQASRNFRRTALTQTDVLKPLVVLLLANVAVLTAWHVVDPLVYVRKDAEGTDGWNRVLATYGQCESENSALPYLIVLAILNLGVLLIANYQACKARNIDKEYSYSESQYIAIAMASLLQAAAVGGPVLLLVRDNSLAWYLTSIFMIFFVSFGILCLMFLPKIQAAITPNVESSTSWNGRSQRYGSSGSKLSAPFGTSGRQPPPVAEINQPEESQNRHVPPSSLSRSSTFQKNRTPSKAEIIEEDHGEDRTDQSPSKAEVIEEDHGEGQDYES